MGIGLESRRHRRWLKVLSAVPRFTERSTHLCAWIPPRTLTIFQKTIKHRRLACAAFLGAARSRSTSQRLKEYLARGIISIILVRKDSDSYGSPVLRNHSLTGRFDVAT